MRNPLFHAGVALLCAACAPEQTGGTVPRTTPTVDHGPAELCINEFVADNATGWTDETGALVDWIEIHNPTDAEQSLDAWYLTDNPDDPYDHSLFGLSIEPRGFLVFAADGRPEVGALHLPFALSADGDEIGLYREDGAGELLTYGPVEEDYAWARSTDCCADAATCTLPHWLGTPGASNAL